MSGAPKCTRLEFSYAVSDKIQFVIQHDCWLEDSILMVQNVREIMKHEKPQAGNPNQLTVNQHLLPRASIERFTNHDNMVEVRRGDLTFKADDRNSIFCARRVWDQKAEEGYLELERDFQVLAGKIIENPSHVLSAEENGLASKFFALVCARTVARRNPIPDTEFQEATPVSKLDKDLLEKLEKLGYVTLNQSGQIPGRMIAGPQIRIQMDYCLEELNGAMWHVAISESDEFLVSDSIDRVPVIPICPTLMLRRDKGGVFDAEEVKAYNELVRSEHDSYYFGKTVPKD